MGGEYKVNFMECESIVVEQIADIKKDIISLKKDIRIHRLFKFVCVLYLGALAFMGHDGGAVHAYTFLFFVGYVVLEVRFSVSENSRKIALSEIAITELNSIHHSLLGDGVETGVDVLGSLDGVARSEYFQSCVADVRAIRNKLRLF